MEIELFTNKRPDKGFDAEFNCSYCLNFHAVIVKIPETNKLICKSCLGTLINHIDKKLLDE